LGRFHPKRTLKISEKIPCGELALKRSQVEFDFETNSLRGISFMPYTVSIRLREPIDIKVFQFFKQIVRLKYKNFCNFHFIELENLSSCSIQLVKGKHVVDTFRKELSSF
jgi:hypothetical protein